MTQTPFLTFLTFLALALRKKAVGRRASDRSPGPPSWSLPASANRHEPNHRASYVSVQRQADGRAPHDGYPAAIPRSSDLLESNTVPGGRCYAFQLAQFAGAPLGCAARNNLATAAQRLQRIVQLWIAARRCRA